MDLKTLLPEMSAKFAQVKKLLSMDGKIGGDRESHTSKYAAIEILKGMHNSLNGLNNYVQQENKQTTLFAVVCLNLGILYIETDEQKTGEEFLMICIGNLSKSAITSEKVLPMISALNQLGILWSQRNQIAVAKTFLERCERIYEAYKKCGVQPISMETLFALNNVKESSPSQLLEKLHTLTLYYLAQVYGSLEDYSKSAVYCHMTLRRQLEHRDFESIEWALNAATLSQFFLEKAGFEQARHYLAAATHILRKYEDTLKSVEVAGVESEEVAAKRENFNHRSADISRCWAKYGILLISASKERLFLQIENENYKEPFDISSIKQDSKSDLVNYCFKNLKFTTIEMEAETIANDITDKYLLDFNDAKVVFLKVQKWLEDAKQYYSLENHASDYVQLVQDMSQAYKHLVFFENNEDRQAKMHKRRIDILEAVINEISETYYQIACRQIWIELGETYSEILDIKVERLHALEERPTPHMLSKINTLATSAIKYFEKFLESLQKCRMFVENKIFQHDLVRPALCTYFQLGRLYSKIITPDKNMQLVNVKKSCHFYAFLVNYCEKDSRAKELMLSELSFCSDLVKLLPLKISKLKIEISKV
ncbi:KIF-binding protein [Belonocnema kinseyi]|uniref:KIF-binding protein n=1 Tax=Belonocnema kinseyi TaxID=2817044 RepID=UPI00143CE8DF|nr:KIF-binding protein [Belonocnema kinseyi]XP_033207159.1 KIF-binding protein [Belonocnema kinseyi]XP_033207160.1 KIF-binding protein [Belonocnema kinseyi]XP_033207161.1 KIF-binding protein [Belonocnema kinseyi]XP_033207162.1 KIF-binding protein [Belonocnema kinseyi]XP_033207163.1 KIF-binding protein [Belonocnema kinseyi]XP_033207164.1 KIF-binding protein [Belonocnema kinseyi]XP_033207166.1 KIF-binding protein [Belonocnema kinseyi]XP_033207167.1 KIF-binding protein [Belonocnema kinseyi]